MENRVKVSIYGGTYSIQGDAAPEYIERLARLVNERMEEVGRSLSSGTPLQVAILAALNIADEYMQLRDLKVGLTGELTNRRRGSSSRFLTRVLSEIFSPELKTRTPVLLSPDAPARTMAETQAAVFTASIGRLFPSFTVSVFRFPIFSFTFQGDSTIMLRPVPFIFYTFYY